ncbi:MAG: hypothetical protein HZC01_03065 [Candidatus Kerfeldbacteria bacterium]|nr:hypothetical protein [Candidatus Kerfeldbacteria bacterium]
MQPLEKSILETIAYFDVFDYPLAPFEVWQWLYRSDTAAPGTVSLGEIVKQLEALKTNGRIAEQWGFYALPGRAEIVETRMDRYRLAERKYFRVQRLVRLLRFVPFVRMIGVCNTLAYSNSRREADIDLFVITSPGRIWQARFWLAGFLKFFRLRPSQVHTTDTLCASFYTDRQHLNLESLALPEDIYLAYWIAQVTPIYDEGVYTHFMEQNRWVRLYLPNLQSKVLTPRRRVRAFWVLHRLIEAIAWCIPERVFKNYQLKVMPERLRSLANQDTRVVVDDTMLKFHDTDRRQQYHDAWRERVATLV